MIDVGHRSHAARVADERLAAGGGAAYGGRRHCASLRARVRNPGNSRQQRPGADSGRPPRARGRPPAASARKPTSRDSSSVPTASVCLSSTSMETSPPGCTTGRTGRWWESSQMTCARASSSPAPAASRYETLVGLTSVAVDAAHQRLAAVTKKATQVFDMSSGRQVGPPVVPGFDTEAAVFLESSHRHRFVDIRFCASDQFLTKLEQHRRLPGARCTENQ